MKAYTYLKKLLKGQRMITLTNILKQQTVEFLERFAEILNDVFLLT